jgi:hypothetical protein
LIVPTIIAIDNKLLSSIEKHLQLENYHLQLENYNLLLELTNSRNSRPSLLKNNNKRKNIANKTLLKTGRKKKIDLGLYDVGDALTVENMQMMKMMGKNKSFHYQYLNCSPKTAMCEEYNNNTAKVEKIECENTKFFSKCISTCRDKFLSCVDRYNIIQEKVPYLGRTAKYLRREILMNPLYEDFRKNAPNYKIKNMMPKVAKLTNKKKKKKLPDVKKLIDAKMSKATLPMKLMKKQLENSNSATKQAENVVNGVPELKKQSLIAQKKQLENEIAMNKNTVSSP